MKILFIGNSHTYFNDMPALFAAMYGKCTGQQPEVTMLAYSGRSLAWHREEYFSVRFALLYGNYDYCVIQQQAHPFPEEKETFASADWIFDLCKKAGTKPVVFMPWAKKEEPGMQAVMTEVSKKLAEKNNALLLPAGELFQNVQNSHPEIELYWDDGAHASPYGDYMIAAALTVLLAESSPAMEQEEPPQQERALAAAEQDKTVLMEKIPGNRGIDFQAVFEDEEGYPHALEDREMLTVQLEEEKTKAICEVIMENLFK